MKTSPSQTISRPMEQVLANEAALATRLGVEEAPYIPPAENFYHSNYILDGCVAAEICIADGFHRKAAKQLNSFRTNQRPNGMVPGVSHPPKGFTVNPERWLSTAPFEANDYTQTPDWARVVLLLHEAVTNKQAVTPVETLNPDIFLEDIYPSLRRYYLYFVEERQVASDDPRIFLLHPHEANRDSGPEYDLWKREELERRFGRLAILLDRVPRTSEHMPTMVNHYNRTVDYIGAIAINFASWRAGWDPAEIHETTEFVDVWFNCHLAENYAAMAELATRNGKFDDVEMFSDLTAKLEQAMTKHFDPEARNGSGGFYSTYNGQLQRKETVGNLSVVLLPNISPKKLESVLDVMDRSFDAPYPLPSVATDEPEYDPHYQERDRHWRGPTWPVTSHIIMEGLLYQASRDNLPTWLIDKCNLWIAKLDASNRALSENGFFEHYNPITGQGQRGHRTKGHIFGAIAGAPSRLHKL